MTETRMDYTARLMAAALHARDGLRHFTGGGSNDGPAKVEAESTLKEIDALLAEGEGMRRGGNRLCRYWWLEDGTPKSVEYHSPVGSELTYGKVGAYRERYGDIRPTLVEYAVGTGEEPGDWKEVHK